MSWNRQLLPGHMLKRPKLPTPLLLFPILFRNRNRVYCGGSGLCVCVWGGCSSELSLPVCVHAGGNAPSLLLTAQGSYRQEAPAPAMAPGQSGGLSTVEIEKKQNTCFSWQRAKSLGVAVWVTGGWGWANQWNAVGWSTRTSLLSLISHLTLLGLLQVAHCVVKWF